MLTSSLAQRIDVTTERFQGAVHVVYLAELGSWLNDTLINEFSDLLKELRRARFDVARRGELSIDQVQYFVRKHTSIADAQFQCLSSSAFISGLEVVFIT